MLATRYKTQVDAMETMSVKKIVFSKSIVNVKPLFSLIWSWIETTVMNIEAKRRYLFHSLAKACGQYSRKVLTP